MRRLGTVLALLGCVLHATLLSWHVSSRIPASFDAARLAADLLVICHEGTGATVNAGDAGVPVVPADQGTDCPVCKGLLGFQLVVLAAAELGLLVQPAAAATLSPADDALVEGVRIRPRSRGPPLSA